MFDHAAWVSDHLFGHRWRPLDQRGGPARALQQVRVDDGCAIASPSNATSVAAGALFADTVTATPADPYGWTAGSRDRGQI